MFVLYSGQYRAPLGKILGRGQSHARVTPLEKSQLKWVKQTSTSFATWQFDQKYKWGRRGQMARWIWMNFGGELWFDQMNILGKFQLKTILYKGTSFTEFYFEQKLGKITEGNGLGLLSWFLEDSGYIPQCTTLQIFSSIGSRNPVLPSQSTRLDRNGNWMVLRNWLDENGSNLEEIKDLAIWSHCKSFIPFA